MIITPKKSADIVRTFLGRARRGETGYKTGLDDVDKKLSGGTKKGDLVIVAGRPGCGKSVFLYHVANYNAEQGNKWLFVSAEMTAEQLEVRGVARRARIDSKVLLDGNFTWDEVDPAIDARSAVPLYLLAASGSNRRNKRIMASVISKALDEIGGIQGICVDYLQRLRATRPQKRRQEINEIAWDLKSLALDYGIPVYLGSQVGRQVDGRSPPVPIMSDMKESGEIEENADIILSVTNMSAYYKPGTMIPNSSPPHVVSDRELVVGLLKQRMGITNEWVWVYFDPRYSFLANQEKLHGRDVGRATS